MNPHNTRRQFIRNFAATTAAASTTLALTACGGAGIAPVYATFEHGVASGDPLSDRVIIWTRVSPSSNYDGREFELTWQVASDDQFSKIVKSGSIVTNTSRDFTAKVDVTGLSANTAYFYRFNFDSRLSPVGRTKTLPVGSVQQVKLAVVSCSNYPAGYFHVYAEIAKQNDLDAVIHLGDYIYEYPRDGYASQDAASLNRQVEPKTEIVTLTDYRTRYAIYRSDTDLQAVHAKYPFITV